jgi:CBS domain-containing protein
MKVVDAMSTKIDYTTPKTKVKEISKLIFIHHINGLPVVKNRKVVGFITEKDIMEQFFPTMKEYMEAPVHEGNFERMEQNINKIFDLTADKIMSRRPITVTPETPLLKAQSIMFLNKVGRLAVVNKSKNMVGIISKGDIFRYLVGDKLK